MPVFSFLGNLPKKRSPLIDGQALSLVIFALFKTKILCYLFFFKEEKNSTVHKMFNFSPIKYYFFRVK